MRMPRFRFTVRRMMVFVAIVGLALGMGLWTVRLSQFAEVCRKRASWYAAFGRYVLAEAEEYRMAIEGGNSAHPGAKNFATYEARDRAKGLHHLRLAAKYEHAARYPWLPVAPDPHEPE